MDDSRIDGLFHWVVNGWLVGKTQSLYKASVDYYYSITG
jgi:hypothetical protein